MPASIFAVEVNPANSADLDVDVLWHSEELPDPVLLVARQVDGTEIESRTIAPLVILSGLSGGPDAAARHQPAAGKTLEIRPVPETYLLPGVLDDLGTTGIKIQVSIEDSQGKLLSEVYSFVVELVPGPGGSCTPSIVGQFSTDAIYIGLELSDLLDQSTYTNLDEYLLALQQETPDDLLQCQISALLLELARFAGQEAPGAAKLSCSFFWQATIAGDTQKKEIYEGPGRQTPVTFGFKERDLIEDYVNHCVDSLVVGQPGSADPYDSTDYSDTSLAMRLSTRLRQGDGCGTCAGSVTQRLEIKADVVAKVGILGPAGFGSALAGAEFYYYSGSELVTHSQVVVATDTSSGLEIDEDVRTLEREVVIPAQPQPIVAGLRTVGGAIIHATDAAFARGIYLNEYDWSMEGNSQCTSLQRAEMRLQPHSQLFAAAGGGNGRLKLRNYGGP